MKIGLSETKITMALVCSGIVALGYLYYQEYLPIYVGPVNVPAVKEVVVKPDYFTLGVSGTVIKSCDGIAKSTKN